MLLMAEKILTSETMPSWMSVDDTFNMVRYELCEKIVTAMIDKELVKIQMVNEITDDLGPILKVKVSTRVYNPDD